MLLEKLLHAPFYFTQGKPIKTWFGNKIIFLTLHRVKSNDKGDSFNDFIDITRENLEKMIVHLKKQNVRFVSLAETEEMAPDNQVCVHFTLDDGYKDNLENALPIFEKHNVPFTLFLTTGIPDREAVLWWYVNAEILNNDLDLGLKNFGFDIRSKNLSGKQKAATFFSLREMFLSKYATNKQEIDIALNASGMDTTEVTEKLGLNWDDVRTLNASRLCNIALHTHHHFRLSSVDHETAQRDIKHGYDRLLAETGIRSSYFAFPFGAIEDNVALDASFGVPLSHCFTTESGIIRKITAANRYKLPRYFVNNGTTGYSLNMAMNGMRFYTNKLLY